MGKSKIASIEWSAGQGLAFLAAVANGEVDAVEMRHNLPDFLSAAGWAREWPISRVMVFEFRALGREGLLAVRDRLEDLLRLVGPGGNKGVVISIGPVRFMAAQKGMRVAGPLVTVALHQAVRLLNMHPDALRQCPAFAARSGRTHKCDRWFVAIGQRQGPERQYCSPTCRAREWAARRCAHCGVALNAAGRCENCRRTRRRHTRAGTGLQRIATESRTERNKKAQGKQEGTRNPPIPTRGNRRV
jgi:hypothetical protein